MGQGENLRRIEVVVHNLHHKLYLTFLQAVPESLWFISRGPRDTSTYCTSVEIK